jgi:hypothetical protein
MRAPPVVMYSYDVSEMKDQVFLLGGGIELEVKGQAINHYCTQPFGETGGKIYKETALMVFEA